MKRNATGRVCRAHLFLRPVLTVAGEGVHSTPYALLILVLLSVAWSLSAAADDSGNKPAAQPVRYMIVITGDELLAGAYPDGHTFFLTRTLRPLGLQCVGSMFVDDNQADVKEALGFAAGKATLIIVTGGLGPTDNDITREALRGFTGIELREHPDVLAAMAQSVQHTRRGASFESAAADPGARPGDLPEERRRHGGRPGFRDAGPRDRRPAGAAARAATDGPGRADPLPEPAVRHPAAGAALTLRFVGLGQSQIDQTLKDHVPLPKDVMTSSQFEGSRVDFTFSLPNDTARGSGTAP